MTALDPGVPVAAVPTRRRLDHIDAMRPIKQVGVVSTHSLLFFAPAGAFAVGASLMLLHVTREAFLFVSACMLTYSYSRLEWSGLARFWKRRLITVALPYVTWTAIYFVLTLHRFHVSAGQRLIHFLYLLGTGYYQLYYLLVILQFYVFFPLLLVLLRRTVGWHRHLLALSLGFQLLWVSLMHWNVLPADLRGFWATREVTSYQLYLIAGMVVAYHFDECERWLKAHATQIVVATVATGVVAELWYTLSEHNTSWLGAPSDPFQPIVIPFNIAAIGAIYLLGLYLVDARRSAWLGRAARVGSDDAYGVYLAQVLMLLGLSGLGWHSLDSFLPWPIVSVLTVVVVFGASVGLTEVLARTPLSVPLTGRTRVTRSEPLAVELDAK